jgi:hypothetical protein
VSERLEDAARRLGAPHCGACKRVGATEHVTLYGEPTSAFHIGVDYCLPCAERLRDLQRLVELADVKAPKEIEEMDQLMKWTEEMGLVATIENRRGTDGPLG